MSWINNFISYSKTKEKGVCPKCGCADIKVEEIKYGKGSLSFVCEKCGDFAHFDKAGTSKGD